MHRNVEHRWLKRNHFKKTMSTTWPVNYFHNKIVVKYLNVCNMHACFVFYGYKLKAYYVYYVCVVKINYIFFACRHKMYLFKSSWSSCTAYNTNSTLPSIIFLLLLNFIEKVVLTIIIIINAWVHVKQSNISCCCYCLILKCFK